MLSQSFSKGYAQTNNVNITWEFIRNANSLASPRPHLELEILGVLPQNLYFNKPTVIPMGNNVREPLFSAMIGGVTTDDPLQFIKACDPLRLADNVTLPLSTRQTRGSLDLTPYWLLFKRSWVNLGIILNLYGVGLKLINPKIICT